MTPTRQFVDRLKQLSDAKLVSERQVCRLAGIKSTSQIAAARKRGSAMNWDQVAALTAVLEKKGYRREWLLFGEKPEHAGDALLGDMVRLGPGAASVPEAEVGAVVESGPLKKRRREGDGAATNKVPAARQDGRGPKRIGASNINHR